MPDDTGITIRDISGDSPDWRQLAPGIEMRVLRTCQATGTWAVLYRVEAGTTASPHMHFGSADSYVIKGKMSAGEKSLSTGDYTWEPNNHRRHEATHFEEDTLFLYIHKGPLAYLDEDGEISSIADWNAMRQMVEGAGS
jgi:anti-sigma factor ChrR (cupin superfamily)